MLARPLRRLVRPFASTLLLLFPTLAPATALADDAPVSNTGTYSPYELFAIHDAEKKLGREVEKDPEGKTIEAIDVVSLEVLEPRDPVPEFLNVLHATTRPYVIRREVLLRVGEEYRKVIADETARNLRALPQLSLVVCAAFKGSAKDKVRVVVISKDVWSLRMGTGISLTPGGLESLLLEPTESNLAGTQQTVLGRFTFSPETYSLGGSYIVPRLDGRRLRLTADANVVMNRNRGVAEGAYGSFGIRRPLFSTRTEWAWQLASTWSTLVRRRYVNARLSTFDAEITPEKDGIPFQYDSRRFVQIAEVTRSFGWARKNDITLGAEINRNVYRTSNLERFDPRAVSEFERTKVPVGETRVGPFVEYRSYTTNFLRTLDAETLSLQEDYRLGHDIQLRLYPVMQGLGSSRSFLGTFAAAQYTVALKDGFARLGIESTVETDGGEVSDGAISGALRIMTPRLGFGRFIFDAALLHRYRNYLNRNVFLGGDTRLRGYPSNFFVGTDAVTSNLEFRTRPFEVFSFQVGGAAFYDLGDAFDGFENLRAKHSVGVGFRILFPQVNRVVFRGDLGFPLVREGLGAPVAPVSFFFAFEQAFDVASVGGTVATGGLASTTGAALGQ